MLFHRPHGFSLFELIITLAVISILCAIALPSFRSQGQQAHQLIAQTKLLSWQLDDTAIPEDDNYHYQVTHQPSGTRWEAISDQPGPCQHIILTTESCLPESCCA